LPFSPTRVGLTNAVIRLNDAYINRYLGKSTFDIHHDTFYQNRIDSSFALSRVTTIHDLTREKFGPSSQQVAAKKKAIEESDVIIAVSHNTKLDLEEIYKSAIGKTRVVHLGVSERYFADQKSAVKRDSNRLLYVGQRDGYKNFRVLVKAFSMSNQLRSNFRLAVFGPKFTRAEVQLMSDAKIINFVDYFGNSNETLPNLYRESKALVVTSKYEGFGLTVLEGMASGCLVFSSGQGSLKEIGQDASIYFDCEDPQSLIDVVLSTLDDELRIEKHRISGLNLAKKFTWENCAKMTHSIYSDIIEGLR
jgi:mannosyltransferase